MSTLPAAWALSNVQPLLDADSPGVLIAASRDPDAKLTYVRTERTTDPANPQERLVVKVPSTPGAGVAVEREGRMLVELRRMRLGSVTGTIPRYVESRLFQGRPVVVSTAMPGHPMSVDYHQWLHTSRPDAVRRDFELAGDWLAQFQAASSTKAGAVTWPEQVADDLCVRRPDHPLLAAALANLEEAQASLGECMTKGSAVHGDFWFGNLLVERGLLVGVVDWESGERDGSPLRDLARFALSYSLYLDRHTRLGHRVLGHPGLRRTGCAPGIRYALLGDGWLPRLVRTFLGDGLARLGLSRSLWYAVALTGIGEVAAMANDDQFAALHLELLAGLPAHARRYR
jgi:hypothetical protein